MRNKIIEITLSALFLAIGIVLPFITGQIQQIGNMLLPMHLPVLLCGMIVGWKYGILIGFVLPILRSALFSMPPMFPTAISMAFELATYGFVSGYLYKKFHSKGVVSIYFALLMAMLAGRIIWGIVSMILLDNFTWQLFISSAFIQALPGIVLQLIIIPVIMSAYHINLGSTGGQHDSN